MANSYWKTTTKTLTRKQVRWPSAGQLFGQLGVILLLVGLWGGLFWGYLSFTGVKTGAAPTPQPEAVAAEVTPTQTPSPSPTGTPTSTPPPQPTSTPSPTPEATQPPVTSAVETGSSSAPEPSPTPTDTPTPTPTPSDTPEPPPTETQVPPTDTPAPAEESVEVSFANDVLPIFEQRCVKCHGGLKDDGDLRVEEGLKLTSHANVMAGSWNGPVVEPGNIEDSYLVEQIVTGEMPKKGPRLLPAEVRVIRAWVEAGAPDN